VKRNIGGGKKKLGLGKREGKRVEICEEKKRKR